MEEISGDRVAIATGGDAGRLRRIVTVMSVIASLMAVVGGYLYYASVTQSAAEWAHREADAAFRDVRVSIQDYLLWSMDKAAILARMDAVVAALSSADRAGADQVLDQFVAGMHTEVCYLIDASGTTIASSNRAHPDSFVGKNYGFRPYFREAMAGRTTIYPALGLTSLQRGIYVGQPVVRPGETAPIGVAVIKTGVGWIEKGFDVIRDGFIVLADPDGVVFMSSRAEWRYRILWKSSPEALERIAASRQFGPGPWPWTGLTRTDEALAVDDAGNRFVIHEADVAALPGWHLIYFHDKRLLADRIASGFKARLGLVILLACAGFGLAILYLHWQITREIARRRATEAARDRLITDLRKALSEVKTLSGLLPICSNCKQIRDDRGYWRQIESYIQEHAGAEFTHSICPACLKKLYPGVDLDT